MYINILPKEAGKHNKNYTKKREKTFINLDNKEYYHSYTELKQDIENIKDSVPTIVEEENVKVKNAFSLCEGMLSLFTTFVIIYFLINLWHIQ